MRRISQRRTKSSLDGQSLRSRAEISTNILVREEIKWERLIGERIGVQKQGIRKRDRNDFRRDENNKKLSGGTQENKE